MAISIGRRTVALIIVAPALAALSFAVACGSFTGTEDDAPAGDAAVEGAVGESDGALDAVADAAGPGHLVVLPQLGEVSTSSSWRKTVRIAPVQAGGVLGQWTTMTPDVPQLAVRRPGALFGNRLILSGGLGEGQLRFDSVHVGTVDVASSTISWEDGGALTLARDRHAMTSDGLNAYAIGGFAQNGGQTNVDRVTFSAGKLSGWVPTQPLPTPRRLHAAATVNGRIYVCGGAAGGAGGDGGSASAEVISSEIQQDGSLGAWTNQTSLPVAVSGHAMVVVRNDRLLVIGGQASEDAAASEPSAAVYSAKVTPTGQIVAWATSSRLPVGLSGHGAAAAGDYVYVAGGFTNLTGAPVSARVFFAHVDGDGVLGEWTETTSLPEALADVVVGAL